MSLQTQKNRLVSNRLRQNHKRRHPRLTHGATMPKGGNIAFGPILILIVVVAAIALAVYPIYPKVTASFQVFKYPQQVTFLSVKLDHLTYASAASVQKDAIFIFPVSPDTNSFSVTAVAQISYAGQVLSTTPLYSIPTGLYSLSFVGNYRTEQPNIFYHIVLNVTFPSGLFVTQTADAPPS